MGVIGGAMEFFFSLITFFGEKLILCVYNYTGCYIVVLKLYFVVGCSHPPLY